VADVLILAERLPELAMPDVSIADASADPVLAPLRRFDLRRFGRKIADVPVDAATRRRWARSWLLRRVQVLGLLPLTLVALVLFVVYLAAERDDVLPVHPAVLAIPLVLANGVAVWMMQFPARPLAQVTNDGDVVITDVDPRAAARWMAANPKGAVTIL
jgi:hypothetical protein